MVSRLPLVWETGAELTRFHKGLPSTRKSDVLDPDLIGRAVRLSGLLCAPYLRHEWPRGHPGSVPLLKR